MRILWDSFSDDEFLSTPSARRATDAGQGNGRGGHISIHALREEGDRWLPLFTTLVCGFLSTPSARRATDHPGLFSRGVDISIHALREEGDPTALPANFCPPVFLSTPSARRATCAKKADFSP